MAEVQENTQGCRSLTAEDRVYDSTKHKKHKKNKCLSQKKISESVRRARVDIGSAFNSWRVLKTTKGIKTDAAVALYLLDITKKMPSSPTSSAASNEAMKFSQSEVQALINEEVRSAMSKNESRLQDLIETIEKQVHGCDLERSIQTLEARINTVTKRAEAALTHLTTTQKKSLSPSLALMDTRGIESEGKTKGAASQVDKKSLDFMDKNEELFQMMETTKKSLKRMRADNDALTAAVADLREKSSLPVPTESERPEVHLALIREPPGLSVLWKLEEEDPSAPPMNSYSIYMTTEKVKGSSIFPDWNMLGEVAAIKLPMCVMINKYKPGHKVCVAVVGKDIFDRYGPYSQVVTAIIPD